MSAPTFEGFEQAAAGSKPYGDQQILEQKKEIPSGHPPGILRAYFAYAKRPNAARTAKMIQAMDLTSKMFSSEIFGEICFNSLVSSTFDQFVIHLLICEVVIKTEVQQPADQVFLT